MKKSINNIFVCLVILFSCPVFAADASQVKQEVTYLLSYLKNSGCQFNRNGTWFNSIDASAHIDKKYQYLLEKKMIATTEDFIEKAATRSSSSGKTYMVQCEGKHQMPSADWLIDVLNKKRQNKT